MDIIETLKGGKYNSTSRTLYPSSNVVDLEKKKIKIY